MKDGPTVYAFAHTLSTVLLYLRESLVRISASDQPDLLNALWNKYGPYEDILLALSELYGRVSPHSLQFELTLFTMGLGSRGRTQRLPTIRGAPSQNNLNNLRISCFPYRTTICSFNLCHLCLHPGRNVTRISLRSWCLHRLRWAAPETASSKRGGRRRLRLLWAGRRGRGGGRHLRCPHSDTDQLPRFLPKGVVGRLAECAEVVDIAAEGAARSSAAWARVKA